jgi:uncharacterized glyoxalase superfamily protein PhnB
MHDDADPHTHLDSGPRFFLAIANFLVDDVVAAVRYYQEVLGFEIDFVFGDPAYYASVFRAGAIISFTKSDPPGCSNSVARAGASNAADAVIIVSELDAIYAEMEERGATISPVVEREYGMREFQISDCNDYRLVLAEEMPPE